LKNFICILLSCQLLIANAQGILPITIVQNKIEREKIIENKTFQEETKEIEKTRKAKEEKETEEARKTKEKEKTEEVVEETKKVRETEEEVEETKEVKETREVKEKIEIEEKEEEEIKEDLEKNLRMSELYSSERELYKKKSGYFYIFVRKEGEKLEDGVWYRIAMNVDSLSAQVPQKINWSMKYLKEQKGSVSNINHWIWSNLQFLPTGSSGDTGVHSLQLEQKKVWKTGQDGYGTNPIFGEWADNLEDFKEMGLPYPQRYYMLCGQFLFQMPGYRMYFDTSVFENMDSMDIEKENAQIQKQDDKLNKGEKSWTGDGYFQFAIDTNNVGMTASGASGEFHHSIYGFYLKPNKYTIKYNKNGGTGSMSAQKNLQYDKTSTLKRNTFTRTGYKFTGWKDESGNFYMFDQPIYRDITLKAAWTPITYHVRFDGNGGKGTIPTQMQLVYGEKKNLPMNTFLRKGYVFCGWSQEGEKVYKEGSAVKNLTSKDGKVVVLKAKWKKGTYKVRFDANGGTGKMKDQTFTCEESKKLLKNTYKKKGYVFTGWNTKKDGEGKTYKNSQKVKNLRSENGEMIILFAMWKGAPYKVTYKGNGATSGKMKSSNYVYGKKSKLSVNKYKKKGYTFVGWNTKKNGKGKNYKNKADIKNLTTQKNKTITLYAKWKIINYKITYNTKGGKLKKSAKKSYTITSKTFTLPRPTKKGYDFDGWYLDKKYKKRISEVKKGKTGNLKLYAKWAKCTGKISKTSAKITNCKAIGTGKIKVQASIKKRVGSSDEYYYLVNVNPMNQKVYRMVKKIYKKKKIGFTLKTSENPGYATSMFGIAVRKNGKYHLISSPNYVKSPEKAAKNKSKYKLGKTKKGIQFSSTIDEVYSCNAKQVFMNFTVSMLCNEATVPYHYNGKIYYFNEMCVYQQIISACNEKGISVSVQFMLDWTEGQTDLIAPAARVPNVAPYYSWNVTDNSAREKMEAMFCYLGYVFGRKNCYVSNWILGNEINNPKGWNYAGVMSTDNYFKTYAYAFRAFYCAIRSQYSNAHIFICMDNLWNTAVQGGYSTKYSITMFLKQLNKMQKGLKWNLAYHAYSTPLTYTNFWEGIGITYDVNTEDAAPWCM